MNNHSEKEPSIVKYFGKCIVEPWQDVTCQIDMLAEVLAYNGKKRSRLKKILVAIIISVGVGVLWVLFGWWWAWLKWCEWDRGKWTRAVRRMDARQY